MSEPRTDGQVLTGAGASLFRAGLARLVTELDAAEADGLPLVSGVRVFDGLGLGEKLAVLEQAGRRMLVGDAGVPHTAVTDAAVAAVYVHLAGEAAVEADEGGTVAVRRMVRAACAQAGLAAGVPRVNDADAAAWGFAIERIVGRIMPEQLWAFEWPAPDGTPEAARAARLALGVTDDDYYVAVAPDPTPAQLSAARSGLRRLTRSRTAARPRKRRAKVPVELQPPKAEPVAPRGPNTAKGVRA